MESMRAGEQLTLTASTFVSSEKVERLITLAIEDGFTAEAPFVISESDQVNEKIVELRAAYNATLPDSREKWLGIEHFKFLGHVSLGFRMGQCSEAFKALVFPIPKDASKKYGRGEPIDRTGINLVVSTRNAQGYLAVPSRKVAPNKHALKSHNESRYAKRFGQEDPNELLIQVGSFVDLSNNETALDMLYGLKRQVRSLITGMGKDISARIAGNSPTDATS